MADPTPFIYLLALQRKPMYQGTVSPETVSKRRERNRAARKARRVTRSRA